MLTWAGSSDFLFGFHRNFTANCVNMAVSSNDLVEKTSLGDSGRPSCTVHRRSSCASYIPGPRRKWRQCKCWTKNDKGSLVVYKQSRQTKTRALTSPSWWNYSQLTRVVEPCWTPLSHQRNFKTWKWTSYFIRIHSWSSAPLFYPVLGNQKCFNHAAQRTNTT